MNLVKIKKNRDFYFDNLKGILILLVIIGNSIELSGTHLGGIHYFILFLYMFHMPLFTFVSGYFCEKSKRTTIEKVSQTFLIYISVQIMYSFFYKYIIGEDIRVELLNTHWTLWYLVSLIFWYIMYDYIKDKRKWLIFSILISLLIGFDGSIYNYLSVSRTIFFFPFFILGTMFNKECLFKLKEHKKLLLFLSITILFILFLISRYVIVDLLFEFVGYRSFYPDNPLFPLSIRVFHYIGAFILGGYILTIIPNKKTSLSVIGKYSLYLYIVHSGVSKFFITNELLKYYNYGFLILSELIIVFTTIIIVFIYVNIFKRK